MDALTNLSALCGIQQDYLDLWGHPHACSEDTRLALLAAMGLSVSTRAEIQASLQGMKARASLAVLPPALVWTEGPEPIEVEICLKDLDFSKPLQWRLRLEKGEVRTGTFTPSALKELGHPPSAEQPPRRRLQLPVITELGYHTMEIQGDRLEASMPLIIVPSRCFQPPGLPSQRRVWGYTLQLYAVRSRRNWGMGDFTDLRSLVEFTAESGGDFVGLNPLHELFPHDPDRATPYSPSSRIALHGLYLDLEAIPEFSECEEAQKTVGAPEFQARLRALRSTGTVDYQGVAQLKFPLLERLFGHFMECHATTGDARGQAFSAFRQARRFAGVALFQSLQEHFHGENTRIGGWRAWPEPFQRPDSPQVLEFASAHVERIAFWEYVQWQAEQQLEAAKSRALALGMSLGLYGDLAIGVDEGGADAWLHQDLYALGVHVGAPPDDFNQEGQDWGLPPLIPHRLVESAFEPFIAVLRANMRHAGALRIDHVMGLMRQFWVPETTTPSQGAYVSYPFQELLGILALESHRHQCLVIGEDLGTVPEAFREAAEQRGLLTCRPLYFERNWEKGSFKSPEEYPSDAIASVGTHDLPTLCGFWLGKDLDLKASLGLVPSEEQRNRMVVERARDRAHLLLALEQQGLLAAQPSTHPVTHPVMTPALIRAVHVYLARTPSKLLAVQPSDLLEQVDPVNLPGTGPAQYPNWRLKLPLDLEEWSQDPRFKALHQALREIRGAPQPRHGTPEEALRTTEQIPRATYRLQLSKTFPLSMATDLVPYLHRLGVSHCYVSPLLKARPGSTHGYDLIDHGTLNPELGSEGDLDRFVRTLHRHGMGLILDVVPNHMSVMGGDNAWWQDVLENGPASNFAHGFDIDWRPLKEELHGKVLLPVLGDQYGRVLERGGLSLAFDAPRGEFRVNHFEQRFPVDPKEYPRILSYGIDRLTARLGTANPALLELESITASFRHLPARDEVTPHAITERARDKEVGKRRLASLWEGSEDIRLFIDENLIAFNGTPGDPRSFDLLHQLIRAQAFRLAYWRVASEEINYRRFFDINDLAGIRMELEPVFEATHRLLLNWVQKGYIDGFRLDHPDGLYDPLAYFHRLQNRAAEVLGIEPGNKSVYVVTEKILGAGELLPEDWPLHGATGYRFANEANGLFVDAASEARMTAIYSDFTGRESNFEDLLYACKVLIIRTAMASELNVLANELSRIALSSRSTCDFTLNSLRDGLSEVVACFPVYRTYITPNGISEQDRKHLEGAILAARKRILDEDASLFDFLAGVLTGDLAKGRSSGYADRLMAFTMKFQQYTAPVMAKGLEDTCFYRYNRLVSLNDVGGDPQVFGTSLAEFHKANVERARSWPHGMLATSTHDSKRSEDLRLRIDALSEIPEDWAHLLERWSKEHAPEKTEWNGELAPSRNDEYLLYQTLIGLWPLAPVDPQALNELRARVVSYMLKAVREAKEHSSWMHPNPGYEQALTRFVEGLLDASSHRPFLEELQSIARRTGRWGLLSGLSLALLKITSPGVPDFYQGHERAVFSLVDPDNRRPVDFKTALEALDELCSLDRLAPSDQQHRLASLLANLEDGRAKLLVTWRALGCRRTHAELFREGDYAPLTAEGELSGFLCAFARRWGDEVAVVVAPRLYGRLEARYPGLPLGSAWLGHRIEVPSAHTYLDAITGQAWTPETHGDSHWLELARVLNRFPVALLVSGSPSRRTL